MKENVYLQYGCGLSAPIEWINFDASPTLMLQKMPIIGFLFKKKVNFPVNVKYGNILKGLSGVEKNSCQGVYCSHVLEHLSYNDFQLALTNTLAILKPGVIFRCVLPDLEYSINKYVNDIKINPDLASIIFLNSTMLGIKDRPKGLIEFIIAQFGNSHHLWMHDQYELKKALQESGFVNIRKCDFNDSNDNMFQKVEEESRFINSVAFECFKPL